MYEVKFQISSSTSITLFAYVPEKDLHLYSLGYISLQRNSFPDLVISRERDVFCPIDDFVCQLRGLIKGELELHPALVQSCVGSAYNNFYQKNLKEFADKDGYWIGGKHELWINRDNHVVTLIYSYKNKFFLEMSPHYPWASDYEPQIGDGYVPYDLYMKSYQLIALLEFSHETAVQWIEHIEKLQKLMYENW